MGKIKIQTMKSPKSLSYIITAVILSSLPSLMLAQSNTNQPFARFPSISPDGTQVAFSYQGDIWVVPEEGGRAWRLTLHEAYEANPHWSPDGKQIAFTSDRYGNNDIFVMDSEGGKPHRLTYYSHGDQLTGWTPDNRLIFTTNRSFNQVEWEPEIHTISASGGTPVRRLDAFGLMPVVSPNGRFIVFVRGYNREYRKHYQGPANKDLWVYDTENGAYHQLTHFKGNDMYPHFSDDHTLFFISERDGTYNLYRTPFSNDGSFTGKFEQLTKLKNDGVRYFDVDQSGNKIVFESKTGLYRLDTVSGNITELPIKVPSDERFYDIERKNYSQSADEYAVSPKGKYLAFTIRGELFIKKTVTDHSRTVRLTHDSNRDRDVAFLNDSTLIFTTDRNGQYDIYLLESSDHDESDLYKSLKHHVTRITKTEADEREPVISPDGKKIAYHRGRGQLVVADIDKDGKLSNEKLLLDGWATAENVRWSPDSKWLAYARPDLDFNTEVYLQPADNSHKPVNISKHPRPDTDPVWSPDGRKLAFLSSRNNGDDDIWFVWLREKDWEKTKLDWEQSKEENDMDTTQVVNVEIDFDGLYKRMRQVTSIPGNESDIVISRDGDTFYFVTNRDGWQSYDADMDLYQVKWDGTEMKPLTSGGQAPSSIQMGPRFKALYMMKSGGHLSRYKFNTNNMESLPFKATMEINHPKERTQIFEEAWRALDKGFYDPNFHGYDWKGMHDKYKPWAMKASTQYDFRDVFNMMLGELNASHMGYYNSERAETQENRTGLLGVEVEPVADGVQITHVIPHSPADREESKLNTGDIITAVDGTKVNAVENFYELLSNKAGERTLLMVTDENGHEREIEIQPTGSLSRELYNEWVENRKRLTEKYSNGRLGYIHIEGMNWSSFERFERELVASGEGKEGIVIDVRYNGGGWTTDYLLTVLNVKQHAFTIPRGATDNLARNKTKFREFYPYGERLPLSSWTRPTIALCNQNSYSNAEIFSHAYKNLNLGTLVGEPTFGAVISTGGIRLMDGSFVRLPFRGWYVKATNENMEHGPAVPDVIVNERPDYRGKDTDAQLEKAVDVLLDQIDGKKGK